MKNFVFSRTIEKKDGTRKIIKTRIKAESRTEAWAIFEKKHDPSSLIL